MDLQSLFYAFAIILMLLMITVMVVFIFFLIKIQMTVQAMRNTIVDKTKEFTSDGEMKIAGLAGSLLTAFIVSRIKNIFRRK